MRLYEQQGIISAMNRALISMRYLYKFIKPVSDIDDELFSSRR